MCIDALLKLINYKLIVPLNVININLTNTVLLTDEPENT